MSKKYFIRRTQADLVQEQNRLLETLLAKQEEKPQIIYKERSPLSVSIPEVLGFDWDRKEELLEEDSLYIPTTSTGKATLSTVDINKVEFDESGVEKLKQARNVKLD